MVGLRPLKAAILVRIQASERIILIKNLPSGRFFVKKSALERSSPCGWPNCQLAHIQRGERIYGCGNLWQSCTKLLVPGLLYPTMTRFFCKALFSNNPVYAII